MAVKFRVLSRDGVPPGIRCTGCNTSEPTTICDWLEKTRWWHTSTFALCDACVEKYGHLSGFVYFIRGGELVKIGYSADPPRRLRDLAVGSPVPLELWRTIPGDSNDELALHERFADERSHGEWFRISERITEYVAALSGRAAT